METMAHMNTLESHMVTLLPGELNLLYNCWKCLT